MKKPERKEEVEDRVGVKVYVRPKQRQLTNSSLITSALQEQMKYERLFLDISSVPVRK